jgi:UDPglucose 6-dehydrogenase
MFRVAVIGTGYVGLVSGICLSKLGHDVVGYDTDVKKIELLSQGILPIYEPGLKEIFFEQVDKCTLSFTSNIGDAISDTDVIIIAVGTPSSHTGEVDMQYVYQVAKDIAPFLTPDRFRLVIDKSTVPVGTSRKVASIIDEINPTADFQVVSNPEFLREGNAVQDFLHPDRIVVGLPVGGERAEIYAKVLYSSVLAEGVPLVLTDPESSELIKYAANGFLAIKVAYINQIADIAERNEANITDVSKALGLDTRIGDKFLEPGPGFGGSCFPKDALALIAMGEKCGAEQTILSTTITANHIRKIEIVERIMDLVEGGASRVAILGLTFKANTDDLRDGPSLTIVPELVKRGVTVVAYDPMVKSFPVGGVILGNSPYEVAYQADILVILTNWKEFYSLDFQVLSSLMKHPIVLDCRNMFDLESVKNKGVDYHSLGRRPVLGAIEL